MRWLIPCKLIYTAYCSVVFMTNSYNPDLMLGRLPPVEYVTIFNYLLADIALYIATTIVFKIAPGLFFLRIMVDKWQRYTIYGTVGFVFVYGIGFFFFAVFQCGNPAHFLEKQILGTCVTGDALYAVNLTAGIINAVADWILALLPVFLLRKAQMPLPAKITAGCLMALGAVGSISSIVRLLFLNSFRPGPNFFWTSLKLTVWSIIECGLCISAASLATLRPLFQCCVENARTFTPSLPGGSTFGGSRAKKSKGSESGSGRSHGERDSFVPLSDMISWSDPSRSEQKTARLEIRHQAPGSFVVGSPTAPERLRAWREAPAREEAARKAKALELTRIAAEPKPGATVLHGHKAQRYGGSSGSASTRWDSKGQDWV
ncbi:hypothetical protein LTR53_008361 [Teratosphaeriaceae sp. CCFEE 6253]|nr:hypothetical protein LTR53_008361 [Teratosphaeriaceae sp. CCFEE 6253]